MLRRSFTVHALCDTCDGIILFQKDFAKKHTLSGNRAFYNLAGTYISVSAAGTQRRPPVYGTSLALLPRVRGMHLPMHCVRLITAILRLLDGRRCPRSPATRLEDYLDP